VTTLTDSQQRFSAGKKQLVRASEYVNDFVKASKINFLKNIAIYLKFSSAQAESTDLN
jgi:hypothetical protein